MGYLVLKAESHVTCLQALPSSENSVFCYASAIIPSVSSVLKSMVCCRQSVDCLFINIHVTVLTSACPCVSVQALGITPYVHAYFCVFIPQYQTIVVCVCVCACTCTCTGPGRGTDGTLGNGQEGREPQQESLWQHHRL